VTTIRLNDLHYSTALQAFHDPGRFLEDPRAELDRAAQRLGDAVGQRLRAAVAHLDGGALPHCVLSTTGLSPACSESTTLNRLLRQGIFAAAGIAPSLFLNGYQCANWGYLLRYFQDLADVRELLVLILDVNLPPLADAWHHPVWENSGFGLTILNFELKPGPSDDVLASHTAMGKPFFEFLSGVRAFADRHPDVPISMPFLPPIQHRIMAQSLGRRALPNRHGEYGHCFGSDPWIGLARQIETTGAVPDQIIAASFALSGYYCAARVGLAANIRVSSDIPLH
jgi:hypothetical protein